ncbi:Fibrocystin [Manis pentadactyla]|nr:Fibrocystin [Manis pentadactyla]
MVIKCWEAANNIISQDETRKGGTADTSCSFPTYGRGGGDLPTDPQLVFALPTKSFDIISTSKEIRNPSRR